MQTGERSANWSEQEQKSVAAEQDDVKLSLAEGNRAYEKKFGFIFIVCAAGKSAPEILEILERRLQNVKETELKDAAEEQPAFSLHMADAGTDSFDRDFALSRLSSEQDAVYEIDEALKRIERGTYGVCEVSGKPIESQIG